jgi:hypothetical protein
MSTETPRLSWTQPICFPCFKQRHPDREPVRIVESERRAETCVDCGLDTDSGIWVRVDPSTARHPTHVKA